ncbi:MAG: hypothetical protein U0441_18325 [Polyangiaceae bacterium]
MLSAIAILVACASAEAAEPSPPNETKIAAAPPEVKRRVRIAYAAPDGCPDETAFVAAIAAQAHPFERAPRSAARVRLLDATITAAGEEHTGVLRVREADGATSERDVRGATCQEVFSALALVAALAVDTGPPPPPPLPPEEPPPPPPPPPSWKLGLAVDTGAFTAMAPNASLALLPSVEIAPPIARTPLVMRIGPVAATSPRADTPAGSADFMWFAGRLDVALFGLVGSFYALRPTVAVTAGAVLGHGANVASPRTKIQAWVDVEAGARASVRLWPSFSLELAGGVLVPITRPTWVFESPDAVIHATPPVGAYVTLGGHFQLFP